MPSLNAMRRSAIDVRPVSRFSTAACTKFWTDSDTAVADRDALQAPELVGADVERGGDDGAHRRGSTRTSRWWPVIISAKPHDPA